MKKIQIAPDVVPRLPVLGWTALGGREAVLPPTLLQATHIRYTTSGRAAIALALRELGVGPGDRVLIPTYHCPTIVAPAVFAGAEPVFYPITASGAPSLDRLAHQAMSSVKAMLVAHYFGIPQPMKAVRAFCDRHGIALIEDCAHCIFGISDGRSVGTWGDFAIASMPKFFATPSGGCLVSATRPVDSIILAPNRGASDLRELANMVEVGARFARFEGLNGLLAAAFSAKSRWRGRHPSKGPRTLAVDPYAEVGADDDAAGFNPDLAFVESTRITRCVVRCTSKSRLVARRRENYRMLASALAAIPGARSLHPVLPDSAVPYVLPIWVDNPDDRYYGLKTAGIPVFRWDWLWSGTPDLPGDYGRLWSRHVFQFPCHQDLTPVDLDTLVNRVRFVFAAMSASEPKAAARPGISVGVQ